MSEKCGGHNPHYPSVAGDEGPERVTVCHRSCSETNPWVRITINSNSWNGTDATECGHGHSGHSVEQCPKATGPYDAWGTHREDYVVRWHGTSEDVRQKEGFSAKSSSEKTYWKIWERACPTVRNGYCCSWDEPEVYGQCCGDDPSSRVATDIPTSTPTKTPAPTVSNKAPTSPPTTIDGGEPTTSPGDGDGGGTKCQAQRKLQEDSELGQKWRISEPTFDYDSLSFGFDFEVSYVITSRDMFQWTIFHDDDCQQNYNGPSLTTIKENLRPHDTDNTKKKIGMRVYVNSETIGTDKDLYSEPSQLIRGEQYGQVNFCLRVGLHTPPEIGNDIEVNFLEILVKLNVDLTDGFVINEVGVAPLDRCEQEAKDAFEVEGYFCDYGTEDLPIVATDGDKIVYNQGSVQHICVRPLQRGLDLFVRMRNIREFTWELKNSNVKQKAIENYQPSSNGLTSMWCQRGYAICHFETILRSDFYRIPGIVLGSGIADLQFGGETSTTSVAPRVRRLGEATAASTGAQSSNSYVLGNRYLKDDAPAASAKFDMTFLTKKEVTLGDQQQSPKKVSSIDNHWYLVMVLIVLVIGFIYYIYPDPIPINSIGYDGSYDTLDLKVGRILD